MSEHRRVSEVAFGFHPRAVDHAEHRPWQPPDRYYRWLAEVKVPEPPTLFDDYSNRTSSARSQKMEIGRDMTLASDLKVLPPGKAPGRLTPEQAVEPPGGPSHSSAVRHNSSARDGCGQ